MQLSQENPDFIYVLRGISAEGVLVNQETLRASFLLTPHQLVPDWRPASVDELQPADMAALLALEPSLVLLGTGPRQRFPAPAVMAALLTRGIGLEVMDSAAAARTFNVLATEGRKVAAAFLVPG
ncbi:MAG TPA: Mth938-like domain-containing protein [Arenimonas sp.]|uniref:Mth938-like domain-containing protein n=1 Tax=Arenimonas sp. TaxID=1872635 RepID=UPI002D7E419A|nr:Mth938-like domain-containing protein [Arenimonas sp.]HEU0153374.1 Mth938-like domain-containing protein [Arenimonas sp.]